ncbi:MAG: aspartyl aminopeptidase [Planctomycetota bacterium]|jgi:aspartyl aminopeptidase
MGLDDLRVCTQDMLDYIEASPSPFHAVAETARRLLSAGFVEIDEHDKWALEDGGCYFVTRNDSSIIAFVVGSGAPHEHGFRIVGAHTDSPNLRIKPQGSYEAFGYQQVGVEIYGGVLLTTWTDRDLGISGRVVIEDGGAIESRMMRIDKPLARVPQLAIHLNREVNSVGLKLNAQKHMAPILGLASEGHDFGAWLAEQVDAPDASSIQSFELMFHVLEKPAFGGLNDEFIFAPRLDNLASCHAGLIAVLEGAKTDAKATRIVACWDHEEVGSSSAQGAAGSFLEDVMRRVTSRVDASEDAWCRTKAHSSLISADMAHAVHPNYSDMHDPMHMPKINAGPVIKTNANARYATQARTAARFAQLCRDVDVPSQNFVMRSDLGCGSTIGPITTSRLGIEAVDVGNPMLSMHSCREMAGSQDHGMMARVLTRFFLT